MHSRFRTAILGLTFAWVLCASLFLAWRDSMTTDEGVHIASAYLALTRGEFRFDPEHPFLFKMVTALPVLATQPHLPPDDAKLWEAAQPTLYDSWLEAREWADQWVYKSGNNPEILIFLARLPAIACLLTLCWLVYFLGRTWFSEQIGIYALIFTAFNPTLLAHGHLANTDVPIALAFLVCLYALWRYYQQPNLKKAALVGLSLALAMLTKFSAISLLPLIFLFLAYVGYQKKTWRSASGHFILIIGITWASLWIGYFGQSQFHPSRGEPIFRAAARVQDALAPRGISLEKAITMAGTVLPMDYLKGLLLVVDNAQLGRPAYLLNKTYLAGIWYYFPILYLLKTQLIGLVLLSFGLVYTAGKKARNLTSPTLVLLGGSSLVFLAFALANKLNLGIRYIAPVFPIASIFMALSLAAWQRRRPGMRLAPLFLTLYIIPVFFQFPHLLGYTNSLVWPHAKSYLYFSDSNLDWGQQAKDIAKVVQKKFGDETVYVNYWWNPYALDYYGVSHRELPLDILPSDALVIITATQLARSEYFGFRSLEPIYRIGNHTYFYRLPTNGGVAQQESNLLE